MALRDLAERTGLLEVQLFVVALLVQTDQGTGLCADEVRVWGGMDKPDQFKSSDNYPADVPLGDKLTTGVLPRSDPLAFLPTPSNANGVINTYPGINGQTFGQAQDVNFSMPSAGNKVTLSPGIYSSISITGSGAGTVEFNPGIYVLIGGKTNTLQINNSAGTVTGTGVMCYNTGSADNATSGEPDASDGLAHPASSAKFGGVDLTSQSLTLSPLTEAASPFNGMLSYQRRWNTQPFSITANGSAVRLGGILYAKWAGVKMAG